MDQATTKHALHVVLLAKLIGRESMQRFVSNQSWSSAQTNIYLCDIPNTTEHAHRQRHEQRYLEPD